MGGYWSFKNNIGLIGRKVVLGVAAIWDRRKVLDDIVRISSLIDAQVIIIGVSDSQKRMKSKEIMFFPRTDSVDNVRKLYAISDVFINPTYEDNYPTTNLEAIACGTPVVTYETGGSPESARIHGIVVNKGDIMGIVNAINTIISNYSLKDDNYISSRTAIEEYLDILEVI